MEVRSSTETYQNNRKGYLPKTILFEKLFKKNTQLFVPFLIVNLQ